MTTNFPGPYEVELTYNIAVSGAATLAHKMRLNCDVDGAEPAVGTTMNLINFKTRAGTPVQADTALLAFTTLLQAMYNTANTSFAVWDLYKYTAGTFQRTFKSTYAPGLGGGSGSGNTVAHQAMLIFRTLEGGLMRINLMESVETLFTQSSLAAAGGGVGAIKDFIISTANWTLGRDTSYPVSPMTYNRSQNEKLYRIRFRP